MPEAMPGQRLAERLKELAEQLGPLPHAALAIERGRSNKGPADRPKKQKARMLKAECPECAKGSEPSIIRIARATAERRSGPPLCSEHHCAFVLELPEDDELEPAGSPPPEIAEVIQESV